MQWNTAGVNAGPVESRYDGKGHGPSICLQDPDGNTVELVQPSRHSDRPPYSTHVTLAA